MFVPGLHAFGSSTDPDMLHSLNGIARAMPALPPLRLPTWQWQQWWEVAVKQVKGRQGRDWMEELDVHAHFKFYLSKSSPLLLFLKTAKYVWGGGGGKIQSTEPTF